MALAYEIDYDYDHYSLTKWSNVCLRATQIYNITVRKTMRGREKFTYLAVGTVLELPNHCSASGGRKARACPGRTHAGLTLSVGVGMPGCLWWRARTSTCPPCTHTACPQRCTSCMAQRTSGEAHARAASATLW